MNDTKTTNPIRGFIRIKQVVEITGLSRGYIYDLTRTGRFPKAVSLVPGGNSLAWIATEIEDWVNERIAERDQ
jgi:prophage regulatory protein